jgi:hypothetical protein
VSAWHPAIRRFWHLVLPMRSADPQELQSLSDLEGNQVLHSFCERRRFWRTISAIDATPEDSSTAEDIGTENGLCFG